MIIKKIWSKGIVGCPGYKEYTGWYLFGFIPLYVIIKGGRK